MNKKPALSVVSVRQAELQQSISKAFALREEKRILQLEAKWVHRYGLSTLPDISICDLQKDVSQFADEYLLSQRQNTALIKSAKENLGKELSLECDEEQLGEEINSIGLNQAPSESITQDFELKTNPEMIVRKPSDDTFIPPPPQPTLSRLRRWLPNNDEEYLPKAS